MFSSRTSAARSLGSRRFRWGLVLALALSASTGGGFIAAQPSRDDGFDRREVMVQMRDGVRLFTIVLTPRAASGPLPIVFNRTPYSADNADESVHGAYEELARDGYIFTFQDIRGRFKSEGEFVMNRPLHDPADPKGVDEATDTYDTIDWLVKNLPRNNGRVGVLGVSYPGWLAALAGVNAHPAVKAISPQAPMTDTWMGDDFFHQGAFRLSYGTEYAWSMEASRDQSIEPSPDRADTYDWYLSFPTLGALADAVGAMKWPTWRNFVEHPAYDRFWQQQALPTYLTKLTVPTLTVGGWWDQEDFYGPLKTYETLERLDGTHLNYLAMGPWSHGQWSGPGGESLGNVQFGSRTADYFRAEIQAPWFACWLKNHGACRFSEATLFDAGSNEWRTFDAWPPKFASAQKLYLHANGTASFDAPSAASGFDEYISDPAHPVPYRPRPVELTYGPGSRWARWMTEDQRFIHNRPDVLSWQTAPLTGDVVLAGEVTARLFASTTGTDADWVVKLIDVYPDQGVERPEMRGYQLMVTGDILRGRYRTSFERPQPIAANAVLEYTVDLLQQLYRFKEGHRIMVQVQSTWFPLYDRNPQTFVPNIFTAPASVYRVQTHRIYRTATQPSHVEMMTIQ
jgi:putative CocE/NonD family hydrolase